MIIARKTLTPRIRNLIGFNAMLMLLFCLVVAYHGSDSYRHILTTTQRNAESLANSLADHTELSFLVADLTVRRAIERQYVNTLFAGHLNDYTSQQFKTWLEETSQVVGIAMVDDVGNIAASAQKEGNNADVGDTTHAATPCCQN